MGRLHGKYRKLVGTRWIQQHPGLVEHPNPAANAFRLANRRYHAVMGEAHNWRAEKLSVGGGFIQCTS